MIRCNERPLSIPQHLLLLSMLSITACTPVGSGGGGTIDCTDDQMICADGSVPSDGLCGQGATAVDAICPPSDSNDLRRRACADSEKVCVDGSAPTDGLCDDETEAVCPTYGGAAALSAGTTVTGGTPDAPVAGGGNAGGMTGGGAAGGEKEETLGTPENPAELGEPCLMMSGEEGICVSDMTTTCQVPLYSRPCMGVNNGCCPIGKSRPKMMSVGDGGNMMGASMG
ncbi:MAG: hypothetical protein VX589_05095, partial [Myxococcota bacterium]|nr:hypothetical protein [Myxococcota bacterium]